MTKILGCLTLALCIGLFTGCPQQAEVKPKPPTGGTAEPAATQQPGAKPTETTKPSEATAPPAKSEAAPATKPAEQRKGHPEEGG